LSTSELAWLKAHGGDYCIIINNLNANPHFRLAGIGSKTNGSRMKTTLTFAQKEAIAKRKKKEWCLIDFIFNIHSLLN
jgi:hypothetical protein